MFVFGRDATGRPVLRRVKAAHFFDRGFYDDFDCCALSGQRPLLEGRAKPQGVRIPPNVCDLGGRLRIQLVPEPEDPISGWKGNPDSFTWIEGDGQGRAQASVLFGQAPLLKAFWKPPGDGAETAERVK